jgi:hypothetical protein
MRLEYEPASIPLHISVENFGVSSLVSDRLDAWKLEPTASPQGWTISTIHDFWFAGSTRGYEGEHHQTILKGSV